jgi:surface antigen
MSRGLVLAAVFAVANIASVSAQDRFADEDGSVVELASITRVESKLDAKDLEFMRAGRQHALEIYGDGQAFSWVNPESGHSGSIASRPGFNSLGDTPCREIRERVLIRGTYYEASGRYCRIAYGNWVNRTPHSRELADRATPGAGALR